MTYGRVLLAASLIALAGASLPGKIELLADSPQAGAIRPAERTAAERLQAAGWQAAGVVPLTENGLYRMYAFLSPDCDGAVMVSAVRPNGEADTMLADLAGPDGRLFFVQADRVYDALPHTRAYLQAKLAPLLDRLGLAEGGGDHEVLAVVVTAGCRNRGGLPWPATEMAQGAAE